MPIFFAGFALTFFIYWLVVLAFLWSIGTLSKRIGTPFAIIGWDNKNLLFIVIHCFGVLWNIAFM